MAALRDPGAPAEVADAFGAVTTELDDVPLPGSGRTWARLAFLARIAETSPALGRLVEGHLDAIAILAELETPAPPDARLGVWAAEPGTFVSARRTPSGWLLEGVKPYASGANELTHALITARDGDDRLLFLVPASAWTVRPGTWQAVGMAGSDSPTVDVAATLDAAALVGVPAPTWPAPASGTAASASRPSGTAAPSASPRRSAAPPPRVSSRPTPPPTWAASRSRSLPAPACCATVRAPSTTTRSTSRARPSGTPGSCARSSSGRPPRRSIASVAPSAPRRSATIARTPAASQI